MANEDWHLSKSVPISLIFALIIQAAAIVWTVGRMQSDIDINKRDLLATKQSIEELQKGVTVQAVQLGRIEENLKNMNGKLDYVVDAMRGALGK